MKISELIKELVNVLREHGDLDVIVDGVAANRIEPDVDSKGELFVEIS